MKQNDLAAFVVFAVAALPLAGCGAGGSEAAASPAPDSESSEAAEPTGFESVESLIAYLRANPTADSRFHMLSLMNARTDVEEQLMRYERSIQRWSLERANAAMAAYGVSGELAGDDLGMLDLAAALENAQIEPHGRSRAIVTGVDQSGDEHRLVLTQRRGEWKFHMTTLTQGAPINDVWYFDAQFDLMRRLKALRDNTRLIEEGQFASFEEAEEALRRGLTGRRPRLGEVHPD